MTIATPSIPEPVVDAAIATRADGLAARHEELRQAYLARDIERLVALFADDGQVTAAPGTFRGKDAVRKFFSWDAGLSPTVSVRDTGIGVLVAGSTVVWERVISLSYEGVPYDEDVTTVIEFGDDGLIRAYRSYYDKLAVLDRIASGLPGVQGWFVRRLTSYLVAQGRKGLDTSPT